MSVRATKTPRSTDTNGSQRPGRQESVVRFLGSRIGRVTVLVLVLAIWEWWTRTSTDGLLPPVTKILTSLWNLLVDGRLLSAFTQSNLGLGIGLLIAIVAGVLLGLSAGRFRWLDLAAAPYLHLAMVIPMVALVPVVVIFFGLGLEARVAVIVLFALPDIAINVRAGVLGVDRSLIEMASAYGATEARLWRRVILPASFPSIMTGIRVGIGRAIMGMVVVELTLVITGVGGLIMVSLGSFQASAMFAVIVVVALEALLLTGIASAAERFVARRSGRVR